MDILEYIKQMQEMYGEDVKTPGTFAANCLLARRLAEKGVKFIQLYHRGWDQHDGLPKEMAGRSRVSQHLVG